jgi:hypothetical protein
MSRLFLQRVGFLRFPLFTQRILPRDLRALRAQRLIVARLALANRRFWRSGRLPASRGHHGLRLSRDRFPILNRLRGHGATKRFALGHQG